MGFEGSLDSVTFSDLLNTLCKLNKEGTLTISDYRKSKRMFFRNNGITLLDSNRNSIGDILLAYNMLKPAELEHALSIQQTTGELIETILVESGVLQAEEIEEVIYYHIEEEICDVFFWENAYFKFEEGSLPEDTKESLALSFDVNSILFKISTQLGEWEQIREKVPSLNIVFIKKDGKYWEPTEPQVLEIFGKVWRLLDGTNDVHDIVRFTELPTLSVCRMIAVMVEKGLLSPAEYEQLIATSDIFQQRGQIQKYIKFLELASQQQPNQEDLMAKIARAYDSIGKSSLSGEIYLQLGNLLSRENPKQAIRYFEMASNNLPQQFEPQEKLLALVSNLEQEEKEIVYARNLARLYQEQHAQQKSMELCKSYLRRYPENLDFHQILCNVYIEKGDQEKAIVEYKEIASIYKTRNDYDSYLGIQKKILEVDPEEPEAKKKLKEVQSALNWQKRRVYIYTSIFGGIFLIIFVISAVVYEQSAKSLLIKVDASFQHGDYQQAEKLAQKIVDDFPWSSSIEKAKSYQAKIKKHFGVIEETQRKEREKTVAEIKRKFEEIKEKATMGDFEGARKTIKNYHWEYDNPKWNNYREEINDEFQALKHFIEEKEKEFASGKLAVLNEKVAQMEKQGRYEEALSTWIILQQNKRLRKRAVEAISRLSQIIIRNNLDQIKGVLNSGEKEELQGNYDAALQKYEEVEKRAEIKSDKVVYSDNDTKAIERIVEISKIGIARIQKWEREAYLKINEAKELEKNGKIQEAAQVLQEVVSHQKLSNTKLAQNILLPIKIETEPSGAQIEGSDLTTPCIFHIKPKQKVQINIHYRGFESEQLILNANELTEHKIKLKKTVKWEFDVGGSLWNSPNIYKHLLVVVNRSGEVVGLRKTNGNVAWRFYTSKGFGDIVGGVAVYDEEVYFGSNDYFFYAINAINGQLQWKFKADNFIQITPTVEIDAVFFATTSGKVYSIGRKSKKVVWVSDLKSGVYQSGALWSKLVFFGNNQKTIFGLDILSGQIKWQAQLEDNLSSGLIVDGNDMIATTRSGNVHFFDVRRSQKLWVKSLDGNTEGGVFPAGNSLFAGTSKGAIYCLNRLNGRTVWKQTLETEFYSAPGYSEKNNLVYITDYKGMLYVLNGKTGDIVYQDQIDKKSFHAGIIVDDDTVYIPGESGVLRALED